MIPRPQLQAYLAGSQSRPAPPALHWREQPVLARLHDALEALPERSSAAIGALVERLFADTAWLEHWVARLAQAAAADPFFDPPLVVNGNKHQRGLVIFSHDCLALTLNVLAIDALAAKKAHRRGPGVIVFTGGRSVQKFLKGGGALLQLWSAPPSDAAFSLAEAHRCAPAGYHAIEDGEILTIDGRTQSYVIDHAVSDIMVLQADLRVDRAPLLVEYDAQTLLAVGASSTNDGASRSQMLLSFLSMRGRAGDADILERYTHDDAFYLRWHAARELLGVDVDRAMDRLRAMELVDPHPDIRGAARSALSMLVGQAAGAAPCHA